MKMTVIMVLLGAAAVVASPADLGHGPASVAEPAARGTSVVATMRQEGVAVAAR